MKEKVKISLCFTTGIIGCLFNSQVFANDSWSGWYMGGSVGLANNKSDTSTSAPLRSSGYLTGTDGIQIENVGDGTFKKEKAIGGVFGGFQKVYSHTLVGIEFSAENLSFNKNLISSERYITTPVATFNYNQSIKAHWQSSVRLRLGYVKSNWMAYVTGGPAITRIKYQISYSDDFLGAGARADGSNSKEKLGWTAGAGIEYAINPNWIIRGEYRHSDFGSVKSKGLIRHPIITPSNDLSSSVDLKTEMLSIGVAYHF